MHQLIDISFLVNLQFGQARHKYVHTAQDLLDNYNIQIASTNLKHNKNTLNNEVDDPMADQGYESDAIKAYLARRYPSVRVLPTKQSTVTTTPDASSQLQSSYLFIPYPLPSPYPYALPPSTSFGLGSDPISQAILARLVSIDESLRKLVALFKSALDSDDNIAIGSNR